MSGRIPPFRLVAEPLTPEAEQVAGFEAAGDEVGTRHRIGDDIMLADAGVVAVYVCFDCFEAAAQVISG